MVTGYSWCQLVDMERRGQERYKLDIAIKIRSESDDPESTFVASGRDISSTGLFVDSCDRPLEKSQRVQLEIIFPAKKKDGVSCRARRYSMKVKGSVVRTIDNGIGIEFDRSYSIFTA